MEGAALGAFALGLIVSIAAAFCVAALVDVPILAAFLAFVPGGIEVMTTLALEVDADPAYVAAHHLARFFALALGVPLAARMLERAA